VAGLWEAALSFLEHKPVTDRSTSTGWLCAFHCRIGKAACKSQSTSMIKIKVESGRMTTGSKLTRNHQDCVIANAWFATFIIP
jgi:hypothetical protein